MTALVANLKKALKSIASYAEKMKPTTLAEATHMLAVISVIASETLSETEMNRKEAAQLVERPGRANARSKPMRCP